MPASARRALNFLRRVPILSLALGGAPVEPAVRRFYSTNVTREDVVVEVGARIGDGTRVLATLATHVHAIEPSLGSYRVLKLFTIGHRNVDIYNFALADYIGEGTLWTDRGFSGVSSLRQLANVSYSSKESVRVTRLDDLNLKPRPTFLILDCEGFEVEVLQGAERSLPSIRMVLVETHTFPDGCTTVDKVVRELRKYYAKVRVEHAGSEPWVLATR